MKDFTKRITVALLLFCAPILACSSGGGSSSSGKFPANCVPIPKDKEANVLWTFEDCGPYTNGDFLQFHYDQVGHVPSGASYATRELGPVAVDKGHVTFKYTDFDWTDMPWADDTMLVVFLVQDVGETYEQANWHMLSVRMGRDGEVITKLVTQRFDNVCLPEAGYWGGECNKEHQEFDKPLFDGMKTYRFDCNWDTTGASEWHGQSPSVKDGKVQCDIYDATGPKETLIQTYRTPTSGPYPVLDTFMVGGRIGQTWRKANMFNVTTDVRVTIYK